MSEPPKNPPQPLPGEQGATRSSRPHRSNRGPRQKFRRGAAPPATSPASEKSALGLDTSSAVAQAPSAPAPAKNSEVDAKSSKTETQGGSRQPNRRPANERGQRPQTEQVGADVKVAPASSNDNTLPETNPAPGVDEGANPRRRGRGRGPTRPGRRGSGYPRHGTRTDKPSGNTISDLLDQLTRSALAAEPDSSSSCSSSVPTPVNPHPHLAPDETSGASSRVTSPSSWSSIEPRVQKPLTTATLDLWAERPPDDDIWRSETAESQFPHATDSTVAPIPTGSVSRPNRAQQPRAPMHSPSPDAAESSQPHPIQPAVDDAPTDMRRIGLAHVLLGPGACVQHVFTDAESPWVMLSNLPRNTRRHHIESLIEPFGPTRSIRVYAPKSNTKYLPTARILFERHDQARVAVDTLQGHVMGRGPITARLDTDVSGGGVDGSYVPGLPAGSSADNQTQAQSSLVASDPAAVIKSCTVKVTWYAPSSTAYVTYATSKFALTRLKELNGRTFGNRRMHMAAMFSEKDNNLEKVVRENGGYMIRITGLMGDPDHTALSRLLRSTDIVVHPNYSSEAGLIKLREELADVAPLESFKLLPNRRDDVKLHALAQYTTPTAAAAAVKIFEKRRGEYLGNSPIMVSRHLTVRYSISKKLTDVLQGEINKLHSWAIDDPDLHVRQQDDGYKPGFVQLTLSGNGTKQLVAAKAQLDRALAGVPLSTSDGTKIWDPYFTTEEGISFLESVAEETNICARADRRTNSILLFGPGYARDDASQRLRDKLMALSKLKQFMTVPKPVFHRLALGGLTILRNLVGKGNIYVDVIDESLTFYGNEEVVRRVQNAIDVMYSEVGNRLRRRSDCVVCLCRPDRALLLHCGHRYCKSCFSQYVTSAAESRTLPLICVGDGCKAPIPLSMISLHASQPDQDALFYAAFQAHISSHPDQYRYCPTPDCQYIYRVGPEDAIVQCRLCLTNICTHCHIEQHEGISCADYKASHDESEIQKSFDRWRAANNVKPCPSCAAPIEKLAGCNHMMCSVCRTHMCWVCMAWFRKGEEVYDHMRKKHGGIGL